MRESKPVTIRQMIIATIIVILTVAATWKIIDYRTQPPPPPHAVQPLPSP